MGSFRNCTMTNVVAATLNKLLIYYLIQSFEFSSRYLFTQAKFLREIDLYIFGVYFLHLREE